MKSIRSESFTIGRRPAEKGHSGSQIRFILMDCLAARSYGPGIRNFATRNQPEVKVSSYFIAQINIHDSKKYDRYLAGYDEVFARYRGEVLAVDDDVTLLEGEWPFGRTVVIRFPNDEELLRWYRSAEYRDLAQHRREASQANIVMAKGRT